ncbi:sugar kinase [Virgibacillus halophilus]|uniref:Sugar kinase n=1 Tax=Tigheibacillus halophilus TaxID=361280 RepID=A0ABU5C367_9BACI|nr:sugar kinase [Virgibacillus halophilus]
MDIITLGETMVLFTPNKAGMLRYMDQYSAQIGGSESNVAIGLTRLGHKVGWISRLGSDEFGYKILQFLRGEGVDLNEVKFDHENPTGIYFKEMLNSEEVRVQYFRKNSAASYMKPDDLNEEYIASAKILHISGITPVLSKGCYETILKAIEIAKNNGLKVVFDPNLRKTLCSEQKSKDILLEISSLADIVLPGKGEGQFLTGEAKPERIANALHEYGSSGVVIKLGEEGAYFSFEGNDGYVPAHPVKQVVDPVGAGDGFATGVLSGLLDGLNIKSAVRRGTVIGSLVTMVQGDIEGLPDRKRLEGITNYLKHEDVAR